jgi:hypothetical protein
MRPGGVKGCFLWSSSRIVLYRVADLISLGRTKLKVYEDTSMSALNRTAAAVRLDNLALLNQLFQGNLFRTFNVACRILSGRTVDRARRRRQARHSKCFPLTPNKARRPFGLSPSGLFYS